MRQNGVANALGQRAELEGRWFCTWAGLRKRRFRRRTKIGDWGLRDFAKKCSLSLPLILYTNCREGFFSETKRFLKRIFQWAALASRSISL
jgi:hypothetical protein